MALYMQAEVNLFQGHIAQDTTLFLLEFVILVVWILPIKTLKIQELSNRKMLY